MFPNISETLIDVIGHSRAHGVKPFSARLHVVDAVNVPLTVSIGGKVLVALIEPVTVFCAVPDIVKLIDVDCAFTASPLAATQRTTRTARTCVWSIERGFITSCSFLSAVQ
jgi:hypothetical protein